MHTHIASRSFLLSLSPECLMFLICTLMTRQKKIKVNPNPSHHTEMAENLICQCLSFSLLLPDSGKDSLHGTLEIFLMLEILIPDVQYHYMISQSLIRLYYSLSGFHQQTESGFLNLETS